MFYEPNELEQTSLNANYLSRPRIDKIFDKAVRCSLVHVIAGAGYGKTKAVHRYLAQQADAVVLWMQLTESDNICSRFWESFIQIVAADDPHLEVKLRELGFPDTPRLIKRLGEIIEGVKQRPVKIFFVLDDFHLIHEKQVQLYIERFVNLQLPGVCLIIISRTEPEINAVSLFAKEKALIITENELRFTGDEIKAFLKQRGVPVSAKELPWFIDATRGWAIALQLLAIVLKRIPQNIDQALDIMKHNIFKLFETEVFNDFPEKIRKVLVRFALVPDLPITALHEIIDNSAFIFNTPQLASFMWFDSLFSNYRIHPLYLEFLRSRHYLLSREETLDTYRQAAQWCAENNFRVDAMRYFAKSHQFSRMVDELFSYSMKLSYDTSENFLSIIENLELDNETHADASVIMLKSYFVPLLLIGLDKYEEARERTLEVIWQWEQSDNAIAAPLLYASYHTLAYIQFFTCTVTHKYDAYRYIKKALEYLDPVSSPTKKVSESFCVADLRSFACLVGEGADLSEFDEFIEAAKQLVRYISETDHYMYFGYDDLVACEIAIYKNQLDLAKKHAYQAILNAREKKQYSIEIATERLLLRIAICEGDYSLTVEILKQICAHLDNPDFRNRQLHCDLALGIFFTRIGLPKLSPSWLLDDEKDAKSEVHISTAELITGVHILIALQKYDHALTVLTNAYPRDPNERFLFGELWFSLLTAVARINTGDVAGALEDFKRAYALSFNGVFEMPFVEFGKQLRPLFTAASKQPDCVIPVEWLKMIGRKASAYAKKAAIVAAAYKKENGIEDTVLLSKREQEVLNDLYHGLLRDEIAINKHLSISTIDKVIQSIYTKLNANNYVDAIRIALEKNVLGENK